MNKHQITGSAVLQKLTDILGEKSILIGSEISDQYTADWSEAMACRPIALIKPASVAELASILSVCNDHRQAIVVQGGLTGLAGGATPQPDELAISLERMTGIEEIDPIAMTLTALAGTPLELLQQAAAEHGLMVPLDLGARGSCTIGGNVSTNAGGTEVIRYGMTRAMVLGLEAVLADGSVISSMNKMLKNNSGYDLKQLFIGTEGTLGVVTRVVLQLQPRLKDTQTALLSLDHYADVTQVLTKLKSELNHGLTTFELMWQDYVDKVLELHPDLPKPFANTSPFYLLVECESNNGAVGKEMMENCLGACLAQELINDAVIAQSGRDAEAFWKIREGVAELLQDYHHRSNQDVSLPITGIGDYAESLRAELLAEFPSAELFLFGHIGDSNLHIIASTGEQSDCAALTKLIMDKVREYGGSVSAEHGIGVLKRRYLSYTRSKAEVQLMKTIKQALDPNNILNPGRVI
ncbi:MAG: FAD-binding oxidoreductase [Pseudomonadota bacterium]